MATQKRSTAKKTSSTKTASKKTPAKSPAKKAPAKKAPSKKISAKKGATKKAATKSSGSVRKGQKTSASTARQTGVKRTNVTQVAQHKDSRGKTVRTKMNPSQAKAKKESLIKQKRSTGEGATCWPGYERVPGKAPGSKGSCKPKPNQTAGERKEDAREAAGSKLRKAGGNKAKANRMR